MRDIGRRIQRYRLSRYAEPQGPVRRRVRWLWVGLAAWAMWVFAISDHGFYHLWRVERETRETTSRLEEARAEIRRLESEARDPRARRELAERMLRRQGMARRGEILYRVEEPLPDSLRTK